MTILITGGSGKTGLPLAHLLTDAGHNVLLASRSGKVPVSSFQGVKFDWNDTSTHQNPFNTDSHIDRMYIVCPEVDAPLVVEPFVELAIKKGVKRFVLLSSNILGPDSPFHTGPVHKYLAGRGVEYAILRPTWFIDNFATFYLSIIRDKNQLPSAFGNGRIPFIAAQDIAHVAFTALTDEKSHNTDHIIVGPDLYTMSEAAALFSEVLGRKIEYVHNTDEEELKFWLSLDAREEKAKAMLGLEKIAAAGSEESAFKIETKEVGKVHLKAWIKGNREIWMSKKD